MVQKEILVNLKIDLDEKHLIKKDIIIDIKIILNGHIQLI